MESILVTGKSEIWIGFPEHMDAAGAYSKMTKVGEQTDDTQLSVQNFYHDIHGDRHGGPQGPVIERQVLGQIVRGLLNLNRFDPQVRVRLNRGNAFATEGTVLDSEIGSLMLRDRSFRLAIVPTRANIIPTVLPALQDQGKDYFAWNFPCVQINSAIECGQGTKHAMLRFQFEAHRAPAGHPKAGIVYNRDVADVQALI